MNDRAASVRGARTVTAAEWLLLFVLALTAFLAGEGGVDDAYIVHRYADRFAAGEPFTFNDGERVEGFTSLAWTTLLGVTRLAGVPAPAAAFAFNWLAIVATGLVLLRCLRDWGIPAPVRLLTLTLFALAFPYFTVCYLGLEFGLLGLLLMVLVRLSAPVPWRRAPQPRPVALGLVGGAVFATRPEGVGLLAVLALGWGPAAWRDPAARRGLLTTVAVWAAVVVLITAWRLLTFGDFLPNSVVAKAMGTGPDLALRLAETVAAGAAYVGRALAANPAVAVILAWSLAQLAVAPRAHPDPVVLAPTVFWILIALENGGDWMPGHRFALLGLPLCLAAFAQGLTAQARTGRSRAVVYGLLVVGATLAAAGRGGWPDGPTLQRRQDPVMAQYEQVGRALNPVWVPGDVAIPEAIGRFGWAAPDITIHDHCGLTDRHLAHSPTAGRNMYGRIDWRYSWSLKPALILLHFAGHAAQWQAIDPGIPDAYVFGLLPVPGEPEQPLCVAIRRDRGSVYAPVLAGLGLQPLAWSEFAALAGATGGTRQPN